MARFVYKEETVKNSINCLEAAYSALSQTEAALNSGFNHLQQVQGGAYIDVGQNRSTICGFPESGRNYINELKNAIESKCAEIQDYNNAPWYKKLFASLGMGLAKFGEGFLTAFENIGDAAISAVGFTAGIFGNENFANSCAEFVKRDLSGERFSTFYKDGTFIDKYSVFGANGLAANVIKGFGTAAGYLTIGKMVGGANSAVDKLFPKVNLKVGETGINSLVAGFGGVGSGTESALLKGKTLNESFFQGLKTGAIQGGVAYVVGKFGDQYAKEDVKRLMKDRNDLLTEKKGIMNNKALSEMEKQSQIAKLDLKLSKVDGSLAKYADRFEEVALRDETQMNGNAKTTPQAKSIDDLGKLNDKQIQKLNRLDKVEATKSGDQVSEIIGQQVENNPELQGKLADSTLSKLTKAGKQSTATGGSVVAEESTGFLGEVRKFSHSINPIQTTKNIVKSVGNMAISNPGATLQAGTITAESVYNTNVNTEARVQNIERVTQLSKPKVTIIPQQNGTNGGYGRGSSYNSAPASTGNVIRNSGTQSAQPHQYTGHTLETAKVVSNPSVVTEAIKNANKAAVSQTTTTTAPKAELTHNTSSSGGRSFASPSSSPSSTPTTSTSSLATSIGTIKANNNKPITTNTTTTTTTTSKAQDITPAATSTQSAISPYQYPTSTQVVAGGNKYPVNKPQIEGSLAQNNVSTTTLGSSGSTHGGGGYSKGGFSLSGSSAVTSDGTIGEQDTKGTLASSITKNKSSKTETIRISESEEEIDQEQKANNFVIPTSAALSAAAAAGIGAKIVMDKKDKDKEEEKEQEESDDDFEIISSDFDNFENDIDDNNNEYEVVESY